MRTVLKYICAVLLLAAPHLSAGQYMDKLYDFDSSYDWGGDISLNADGSYFVIGEARRAYQGITNMTIAADGTVLYRGSTIAVANTNAYFGNTGEAKRVAGGDYIVPITFQINTGTYFRSWGGAGIL